MAVAPRLYAIVDRDACGGDGAWLRALSELSAAMPAAAAIQVRDKCSDEARTARALEAARACAHARCPIYYNGSQAEAARFAGAHLPEAALPTAAPGSPFAASVHSLDAARVAEAAGALFLVFAPVFDPGSKPGRGVGLEALGALCRATALPVLALGGVSPERVRPCLDAGAHGVAVLSGILSSTDRRAAIARYQRAL